MNPPKSHVTIRDVATLAGVSHQTVSRVINSSERVNPETRQRVEDAIAALDYRPNAIAQFLGKGRTHLLACISPNLTDYTFASIIEGAETRVRQQGYFLLSASAPDADAFAKLVDQLLASRQAEGLLVINPYMDERHLHLPHDVPTIFVGTGAQANEASSVSLDNESAAFLATQHLIDLGHTNILCINGPQVEDCTLERSQGYTRSLQEAGISFDPGLMSEGDWSATSSYLIVQAKLAEGKAFTAIQSANDRMAVGAVRALREAGLRIPDDVSVIGFDDMPLASYFDPPLTTIRQDTFEIGRQAGSLLIKELETSATGFEQVRLPGSLIVRQSTAPLASASKRR